MVARGSPKAKVEGSSPLVVEIFLVAPFLSFSFCLVLVLGLKNRSTVSIKEYIVRASWIWDFYL